MTMTTTMMHIAGWGGGRREMDGCVCVNKQTKSNNNCETKRWGIMSRSLLRRNILCSHLESISSYDAL